MYKEILKEIKRRLEKLPGQVEVFWKG